MAKVSYRKLDWLLVGLYLFLVIFGWMNVYSSSSSEEKGILDFSTKYGMLIVWIVSAFVIATLIVTSIPHRLYSSASWLIYLTITALLLLVAFVGVEVNGSKSWFALGPVRFQPAEFSKISTSLLLAQIMSKYDFRIGNRMDALKVAAIILIPILFILLEKETGSALVYLGFLLMLFREGMSGWILVLGGLAVLLFILTLVLSPLSTILIFTAIVAVIWFFYARDRRHLILIFAAVLIALLHFSPKLYGLLAARSSFISSVPIENCLVVILGVPAIVSAVLLTAKRKKTARNAMLGLIAGLAMITSVQFIFDNVLKEHQRARIETLLGLKEDPMGVGYNVHQSLIAIGSGGFSGKGYLQGTQTRFNFVPEQSTDFIFCTIGEEWGFLGTITVLAIYLALILRLMNSAEKQNSRFTRIYGYCVASCLLMHVLINICMTIGLMPVIGIPLPLLSYGGSSLWAFTILIFIYIRLDFERWK
ncbi:MAG: rod shape-determining protein RodA [Bacteroidales bacterium]|nr:rod shape-determining protein RodA [Candidatus Cacconaster merdequi]